MNFARRASPYTLDRNGQAFMFAQAQELQNLLTQPRMAAYLREANGDAELAFRLYRWNIVLSESLLMPFHFLEVSLRNRLDDLLKTRTGVSWPLIASHKNSWTRSRNPIPGMPSKGQATIHRTRSDLNRRSLRPVTADCVVSQLTFGFWVMLFNQDHDQFLWGNGVLARVFPHAPAAVDRGHVSTVLEDLRNLRNRIAHHEIIFTKFPVRLNNSIEEVCGWIDPDLYHLVRTTSDFRRVQGSKPV